MATPSSTVASRRERRAAERAARTGGRPPRPQPLGRRRSTPSLGMITLGAVVLAGLLIAFTALSQQARPTDTDLIEPPAPYPAALQDGRALGATDAPVTLIVWSDFQCPVCARYADDVEPLLVNRYVTAGLLRIEHRDAAILGDRTADDESFLAAAAARAADEQGAYWTYHNWLFANQDGENRGGFARGRLVAMAEAAGLDVARFEASLDAGVGRRAAIEETDAARAAGIASTPTLVIGDLTITGLRPVDELEQVIDAALVAAGVTPPAGS